MGWTSITHVFLPKRRMLFSVLCFSAREIASGIKGLLQSSCSCIKPVQSRAKAQRVHFAVRLCLLDSVYCQALFPLQSVDDLLNGVPPKDPCYLLLGNLVPCRVAESLFCFHTMFWRLERNLNASCRQMYSSLLEGRLEEGGFVPAVKSLGPRLVDATIELHKSVMQGFLPSAVKFHYQFNLRELSNITQVGAFRLRF